ncbi:hypothetical protein OHA61_39265 [Streptomyces sp. NBC_00885]|nr:hypothetical protein OHA61_39265 [Streptomyces sp. NBC_00885]
MSDSGAGSRVVVGTFFKDKNYGGGSLTLVGPELARTTRTGWLRR